VALLVTYCVVRTLFFASFVETPEPRYVLECFPAVIALAAQVFASRREPDLAAVFRPPSTRAPSSMAH
jgi:hypothetical protein